MDYLSWIDSTASKNGLYENILIVVSGSVNLIDLPFPGSSPFKVLKTSPTVVPNTFIFCFSTVIRGASSIAWIASVIGLYTRIFVVVTGSI